MKVEQAQFGRQSLGVFTYKANVAYGTNFGNIVALTIVDERNAVLTRDDGVEFSIFAVTDTSVRLLEDVSSSGLAYFCCVVTSDDSEIVVEARLFPRHLSFSSQQPLVIGVTDAINDDLPKGIASPVDFLSDTFTLKNMAFALSSDTDSNDTIRLLSQKYTCDVSISSTRGVCCTKIQRNRTGFSTTKPITLLRGHIQFVDSSLDTVFSRVADSLREGVATNGSYLSRWRQYNEAEERIIQANALAIGCVYYKSCETHFIGKHVEYVFNLANTENLGLFPVGLGVTTSQQPFRYDDYSKTFIHATHPIDVGQISTVDVVKKMIRSRSARIRGTSFPLQEGYLMPSLSGDKTRLERRRDALDAVETWKTPLKTLGILLEKGDAPYADVRYKLPLSERTKDVLQNPTENQRKAIQVALNTPDIAIIQGPPGTGKTTVIRMLVARYLELAEERDREHQTRILISSFQHDAVDNVIEGQDLTGMPTNRFGGRQMDDEVRQARQIDEWIDIKRLKCKDIIEAQGPRPARVLARQIDLMIDHSKRITGTQESVPMIAKDILMMAGSRISSELAEDLRQAVLNWNAPVTSKNSDDDGLTSRLKQLLDSQCLDPDTFANNGPLQAQRICAFLSRSGSSLDIKAGAGLVSASAWDESCGISVERTIDALNDDLSNIKNHIFSADHSSNHASERVDVIYELLARVSECLHELADRTRDGIAETVEQYLEDLEQPEALQRMIDKYCEVLAATCQQSARIDLEEYDLVIVDEAARANPPDLLIPLSRARKIVLVGDHKQLPHMYEEHIVQQCEMNSDDTEIGILKTSMFERLYDMFAKSYSNNSPLRTVMLTDDFRMHPAISKYISDTFYGGKVVSRAQNRCLELGLYENKPICWIDVTKGSHHENHEKRIGTSYSRIAEARVIKHDIEKALRADLSCDVGVIAYYKPQVELIEAEIASLPDSLRKRIRVNTVDAFQGREFDIVFLSAVRCNDRSGSPISRVGFLALTSRLCVSLSRAKQLMVVVGDAETLCGTPHDPVVPELIEFLRRCKSDGGHYEQR